MTFHTEVAILKEKLEHIHEDVIQVRDAVKSQNGRVRKLEVWRGWITGGLCLLGVLFSYGVLKLFGG